MSKSLREEAEDFDAALRAFLDEVAKAARIYKLLDWLTRVLNSFCVSNRNNDINKR
jgi:hypothetical protein